MISSTFSSAVLTFCLLFLLCTGTASAQEGGQRLSLDLDWKFMRGDNAEAKEPDFDDQSWRNLDVPHDWSIEGPYKEDHPTMGSGGFLPAGIGWYRKHFNVSRDDLDRHIWVEFDGVYMNSEVWINGHHLGKRPFGYIGFHYVLSPHLVEGNNVIAVRVDNAKQPGSRWYSGSGIYRHVWLVKKQDLHVGHWGVYVTTPEVSATSATVKVRTQVENRDTSAREGVLRSTLLDADGAEVAGMDISFNCAPTAGTNLEQGFTIPLPDLWSVDTPTLYSLRSQVLVDGAVVDDVTTPVGIRSIAYDKDRGFLLNGKRIKMKGVNLHHDGGAVGAAVPEAVWERRLLLLKDMGCNAIRTAHNPPAPEFLDLCDQMGFLVMDEAFDEWRHAKGQAPYMYHLYFDEWAERDLTAMLHRDRNHPSIVLWSVGNEVPDQKAEDGAETLRMLSDICHREDPTRPVTQGCDNIAADGGSTTPEFLEGMDVVGYNYVDRWRERTETYASQDRHDHPDWVMIGTESSSYNGTRANYSLGEDPAVVRPNYNTRMIRAEALWKYVSMHDYFVGDFMWTGIDYLGESWWPGKHAQSGPIDLAGFPKDGFYFYQSQWTETPMLHLLPHWNWAGREGQTIPVICFSNCDAVELFLNGRSLGEKRMEFPRQGMTERWAHYDNPRIQPTTSDLHLTWDVPYEPGVLRAVGKRLVHAPEGEQTGRWGRRGVVRETVFTRELQTTGVPAAIGLSSDRDTLTAGVRDIAHIRVEIVDAEGRLVPTADNQVKFEISGPAEIIAVDNSNPRDHDSYQAQQRNAYGGLCLVIVQSTSEDGVFSITATAEGLTGTSHEIPVK
jgi:beta-galactosidase